MTVLNRNRSMFRFQRPLRRNRNNPRNPSQRKSESDGKETRRTPAARLRLRTGNSRGRAEANPQAAEEEVPGWPTLAGLHRKQSSGRLCPAGTAAVREGDAVTWEQKLAALKSLTETHLKMREPGNWYVSAHAREVQDG